MKALVGKTVGIAGLGNIGPHIAKVCKALGMTALGLKRTSGNAPSADVDALHTLEQKLDFIRRSDFVIDVLPLTPETENYFGTAEFEAMRGHWFINIGRGGSVDEKALCDALKDGTLAGAGLDPWWVYPVILTPRDQTGVRALLGTRRRRDVPTCRGGFTDVSVKGLWTDSFESAIRADRGETLCNLVDLEHGY